MSAPAFAVPPELEATEPPELRGVARDEVRLMVVRRGSGEIAHACFRDLPEFLEPGDLVVINNSATLPAAVPARLADGTEVELRFADRRRPGWATGERWWVVEARSAGRRLAPRGAGPRAGSSSPAARAATVVAPYAGSGRLWLARVRAGEPVEEYLLRYGHPIRYGYVPGEHPLAAYQTASRSCPARPRCRAPAARSRRGSSPPSSPAAIQVAPVTLHAGVSSPERSRAADRRALRRPRCRRPGS